MLEKMKLKINYYSGSSPIGVYCFLFCVLFIHVARSWMCVLFYYSCVCLSVYAFDSKSIAGVPLRRDSTD